MIGIVLVKKEIIVPGALFYEQAAGKNPVSSK